MRRLALSFIMILSLCMPLYPVQAKEDIVTREEAVQLLLQQLYINPVQVNEQSQFTDLPKGHSSTAYIQYATEKGYIHGYSKTIFGFGDPITFRQFIIVLMNIYGYNDTYNTGIKNAIQDGILLERMVPGDISKYVSHKEIQDIIELLPFRIREIELLNLKELKISFTKPTLSQLVLDLDNYESNLINFKTASIKKLSEIDYLVSLGKPLDVTDKNVTIAIDHLLSDSYMELQNNTITVPIRDSKVPTIDKVQIVGTRHIKVDFNEPINTIGNTIWDYRDHIKLTKVSGSKLFIEEMYFRNRNRTLYIQSASPLSEDKYILQIEKFLLDYNNNELQSISVNLDKFSDQECPKVIDYRVRETRLVELTFDEPIQVPDKKGVYHTNKHSKAEYVSYGSNMNQLIVSFEEGHDLAPVSQLFIEAGYLSDLYGNTNKEEIETTVKGVEDRESPILLGIEILNGTELKISYNEYLDKRQCERKSNFSLYLKNKKGKLRSSDYKITVNKRYITLTLRNHTTEDIDSMQIKGIEDLYSNRSKETERLPIN